VTTLEAALRQVQTDLTRARVAFALIGGLAVSARTEPRFTRDADLAVAVASDAQAEALIHDLRARSVLRRLMTERTSSAAPTSSVIESANCSTTRPRGSRWREPVSSAKGTSRPP
jgi:hypothetical protein